MDQWLSIRRRTVKLLEKNIEVNLHELGFDNIFLAITITKIDKLHFIKSKIFCESNNTIKRMKRQLTEWEKLFADYMYAYI